MLKNGGVPVSNGAHNVTFTIYDAATAGTAVWTETQSVTTTAGLFSVQLGDVTPIPTSALKGASRYLGIAIESDPEMTPREDLVSVPYCCRARSTAHPVAASPATSRSAPRTRSSRTT